MSYGKLIKDSFANMNIFPEKNLVVNLSTFVLFTAKEFILVEVLQ